MNIKKKILSFLITICIILSDYTLCLPVSAAESGAYVNIYRHYLETYGHNTEESWSGKTSMKENTIYYVDRAVTVSVARKVPKSSMLVVKSGGHITVKNSGALYSQGHLAVEEGGIIEVDKSKLVINSGSLAGVNGSLYINAGSELKLYSFFFLYMNGLFSLSGLITVYKNGGLFCANDIRTYESGRVNGEKTRISGLPNSRFTVNTTVEPSSYMRFYDRMNHKTYLIRSENIIKKICDALNKISLVPIYESMPFDSDYVNRYGIRLYDANGNDYFYFERPDNERNGFVYLGGVTYIYPDSCITFDEFYYYALGVKDYAEQ